MKLQNLGHCDYLIYRRHLDNTCTITTNPIRGERGERPVTVNVKAR
jgi:hypothetical protein